MDFNLLHQMRVKAEVLNGDLQKEVYMIKPEELEIKSKENLACTLKKSSYGLE